MYLVFDVGGTFVKYAIMTSEGEVLDKGKTPTRNKPGEGVEDFLNSLEEIYVRYRAQYEIEGIAAGLPGQIDVEEGIVYGGGGIPYLDGVRLQELLSKRCGNIRVSLENDGKCAALAEVWKGNASEAKNAVVLVFGTGIGGGIIIDRKVHRGEHLLAGEVSFCLLDMDRKALENIEPVEAMKTVEEEYEKCYYLQSAQCATGALVYRVASAKGLSLEEVDGEKIYQWVGEGDRITIDILEDAYFDIAKLCVNLYVSFDPDVILIGGGISAQPAFFEGINRYVEQLKKVTKVYRHLKLDVCKFRNDSNLLGALYHFKQKYSEM